MNNSIIFNKDELIPYTTGDPVCVEEDVFMDKLLLLVGYEKEYTDERLLRLRDAEKILLWIKANMGE